MRFVILREWKKSPELILSIVYLAGAIATPNNKVFFGWSVLFFLAQVVVGSSFFSGLIFSFIPLSLFTIGQLYQFTVIEPRALNSYLYQAGRSLYFTVSPAYVLSILCIVGVPLLFIQLRKRYYFPISCMLLVTLLLVELVSASKSIFLPYLSVLFLLSEFGLVSWLIILINLLKSTKKYKQIFNLLLCQLLLVLAFHSSVTLIQVVKRAPIGLKIEQTDTIPYFGSGADENANAFRPVGLRSDPNTLANELLVTEGVLISLWLFLLEKKLLSVSQNLLLGVSLLGVIALILTQSRSIYLGMAFFLLVILLFQRQKMWKLVKLIYKKILPIKFSLLLIGLFLLIVVGDRLWRSQFSFSASGGFTVRAELVQEATALIQQNYWWGVGTGMFIPAAYQNHPSGVMQIFPESVHNGFYLFFAEKGIWAVLIEGLFLFWMTRLILQSQTTSFFKYVCGSIQLGLLVAMIFQPMLNFVTIFSIFIITLLEADHDEFFNKKN